MACASVAPTPARPMRGRTRMRARTQEPTVLRMPPRPTRARTRRMGENASLVAALVLPLLTGCASGLHTAVGATIDTNGKPGLELRLGGFSAIRSEDLAEDSAVQLPGFSADLFGGLDRDGPYGGVEFRTGLLHHDRGEGLGYLGTLGFRLIGAKSGIEVGPNLSFALWPWRWQAEIPVPCRRDEADEPCRPVEPDRSYHGLGLTIGGEWLLSGRGRAFVGPSYSFAYFD